MRRLYRLASQHCHASQPFGLGWAALGERDFRRRLIDSAARTEFVVTLLFGAQSFFAVYSLTLVRTKAGASGGRQETAAPF